MSASINSTHNVLLAPRAMLERPNFKISRHITEEFKQLDSRISWQRLAINTTFISCCILGRIGLYNLAANDGGSNFALRTSLGVGGIPSNFTLTLSSYQQLYKSLSALAVASDQSCFKIIQIIIEKFFVLVAGSGAYFPTLTLSDESNERNPILFGFSIANAIAPTCSFNALLERIKKEYRIKKAQKLIASESQRTLSSSYRTLTEAKLEKFRSGFEILLQESLQNFLNIPMENKRRLVNEFHAVTTSPSLSEDVKILSLIKGIVTISNEQTNTREANIDYCKERSVLAVAMLVTSIFLLITGSVIYSDMEKQISNKAGLISLTLTIVLINFFIYSQSTKNGTEFIFTKFTNICKKDHKLTLAEQLHPRVTNAIKTIGVISVIPSYGASAEICKIQFTGIFQDIMLATYPASAEIMLLGPMINIAEQLSLFIYRLTDPISHVRIINFVDLLEKTIGRLNFYSSKELAHLVDFLYDAISCSGNDIMPLREILHKSEISQTEIKTYLTPHSQRPSLDELGIALL